MRANILETGAARSKFRSVFESDNQRTTLAEEFLRKQEKAFRETVNKGSSQRGGKSRYLEVCKTVKSWNLLSSSKVLCHGGVTPIGKELFF